VKIKSFYNAPAISINGNTTETRTFTPTHGSDSTGSSGTDDSGSAGAGVDGAQTPEQQLYNFFQPDGPEDVSPEGVNYTVQSPCGETPSQIS
jgi:hypothetical protein